MMICREFMVVPMAGKLGMPGLGGCNRAVIMVPAATQHAMHEHGEQSDQADDSGKHYGHLAGWASIKYPAGTERVNLGFCVR